MNPPRQPSCGAIVVTWDPLRRRPKAFVWRRRRYRIERVVQRWVIETGWWNDGIRVSRQYSRVSAEGRVFDIYFDRQSKQWFLERALN
jgi:hypothetical protein